MTLKEQFPYFYRPNKAEVDEAYKSGWFVFDTCSLLNIYGLELADKVLRLLEANKDRIKIPFHVAEEYHKDIYSTIAKSLSYTRSGIAELQKKEEIKKFRETYKKYFTNSTVSEFSKRLEVVFDEFIAIGDSQFKYLEKQYNEGVLQEKLSNLLGDNLLPKLPDATLTDINDNIGPKRYADKTPPGYEDAGKDDNKYGDLIIWAEILEFAKTSDKDIIFVCDDVKPDMLYKPSGYVFGAHLSMLKEFHEANPNIHYHLCTLESFIHHVNEVNKVMTEEEMNKVKMDIEDKPRARRLRSLKSPSLGGDIWPELDTSILERAGITGLSEKLAASKSQYQSLAEKPGLGAISIPNSDTIQKMLDESTLKKLSALPTFPEGIIVPKEKKDE